MYISMNWINDFVDLSGLDAAELIHRFTLSTAEVEDIIYKGRNTEGVLVARILSVENHPNSKKLHLLKVDTGSEVLDVVCGAPNVREGMRVALATAGGKVGGMAINVATVGGYESHGMCCSEAELGISADNSGIIEIEEDVPLGTSVKDLWEMDDVIFEVDNKSLTNRPDLWGHYGIAREFATIADRTLRTVPRKDTGIYANLPEVAIDIRDVEHCYRYTGIKVENIHVKKSPMNMRIRLFYCGSRAINLLADLTNYVMMELGQPMHAFDLTRVDGVEVQRFSSPFKFTTLDGTERDIDDQTLMICSHGEPVAVAGIMGGLDSEIREDTTALLLESATFDGVCVRKSSSRLGLRTDASMRYEKTLDPELCKLASERFLYLLFSVDPAARVISALTDRYAYRYPTVTLKINKAFVDRYTGIDISVATMVKTLASLGFGVEMEGEDALSVTVPSWRATKDVTIKADLIEEITRIYGYDNFEITTSRSPLYPVRAEICKQDDGTTKDLLVEKFKMHEVHSYIWCDSAKLKDIGIEVEENPRLLNAQTPEHTTLRNSMIPTLLCFVGENKSYGDAFGLFEIGRVCDGYKEDGTCNEQRHLGCAVYDRVGGDGAAYFKARDMAVALIRALRHEEPTFQTGATTHAWQHPVNTAAVFVGNVKIGEMGTLHPAVKNKLDKKAGIAFLEFNMSLLEEVAISPIRYDEPSRFPSIDIDLSFVGDVAALDFSAVKAECFARSGELLKSASVADIYKTETEESITLRFTFSAKDRTLTKAELAPITEKIVAVFAALGFSMKA